MKSSRGPLPTVRGTIGRQPADQPDDAPRQRRAGRDRLVRSLRLDLDVGVRRVRVDLDLRLARRLRGARHDRERLHQHGVAVDVRQPALASVGEQLLVIGHGGGVVRVPGDAQRLAHGQVRRRARWIAAAPVGNSDSPPGGTRVICQAASCIAASPRLCIAKSKVTAPRAASAAKRFSTSRPSAGVDRAAHRDRRRLDLRPIRPVIDLGERRPAPRALRAGPERRAEVSRVGRRLGQQIAAAEAERRDAAAGRRVDLERTSSQARTCRPPSTVGCDRARRRRRAASLD